MSNETDPMQVIAAVLMGIQDELKTLNKQVGQLAQAAAKSAKPEGSSGSYSRGEYRPKQGVYSRSGPPRSGKPGQRGDKPGQREARPGDSTGRPSRKPR